MYIQPRHSSLKKFVGSIEWIAYTLLSFSICCLAALDYKDAVVLTPTQYRITVTICVVAKNQNKK